MTGEAKRFEAFYAAACFIMPHTHATHATHVPGLYMLQAPPQPQSRSGPLSASRDGRLALGFCGSQFGVSVSFLSFAVVAFAFVSVSGAFRQLSI